MAQSKKSSKKNVTKPPRGRKAVAKRLEKASPPPDNPMLRHLGVNVARVSGVEDVKLTTFGEGMRAAVAVGDLERAQAGKHKKSSQDSAHKQLAERRLTALDDSRNMPGADADAA